MNRFRVSRHFATLLILTVILFVCRINAYTQSAVPAETIAATTVQTIHFGAFCITGNSGGTITVSYDGTRTATGDIVLLSANPAANAAVFELNLHPGKRVTIATDETAQLNGTKGSSMRIDIGPTDKGPNGSSFMASIDGNPVTFLRVGGTLHIPANCRAGSYSGAFNVSFKEE
jgi:hypothetical protein